MDTLAYLHSVSAYEEAPAIASIAAADLPPLFEGVNWNKLSSGACLALIPVAVAVGVMATPQQASAGGHCYRHHSVSVSCKKTTVAYKRHVVYKPKYIKVFHRHVDYHTKYIKVFRRVVIPDYKYVRIYRPVVLHKTRLVKRFHPVVIKKPVYRHYTVVKHHGCCKKIITHRSKCFHKKVIYRPSYHYRHYSVVVPRVKYAKVYHPIVVHKAKYIKVVRPVVHHSVSYAKTYRRVVFYKPVYRHHYYKVAHRPSRCGYHHAVYRPKYHHYHHRGHVSHFKPCFRHYS
jgi:hypothetical protein